MTKKVNIYPTMPITGVNPPIRSVVKNVTMDSKDIRTCIMARAKVEEIINGETINLDLSTYDTDNSQPVKTVLNTEDIIKPAESIRVEESVIETPVEEVIDTEERIVIPEPVIEEATAEEIISKESVIEIPVEEVTNKPQDNSKTYNKYNNKRKK